ncbi:hypothetical protein T12_10430 [Trichinella patagoniensis]|uniref:Uncharacterized protein n=1 Tax=Trichinella patagoniensis TaxID=990121 RepID=A0A0V0ZZ78_9BILA|nr:hypothetical protein T12_3361 [Trichinella patagoniensis]KRY17974.1 hypothetical protein T12_10430 [Trichinella patagoniensis]
MINNNSADQRQNTGSTISNSSRVVMRLINAAGMLLRKFTNRASKEKYKICVRASTYVKLYV